MVNKVYKYHYIYKTVCNVNQKYYIGMHSTDNLEDGYQGSGKRLWYSINKYGKEAFTFEILEFLPCRKTLCKREKELVNLETLKDPLCLNLREGGRGGWSAEQQRENARRSNIKQEAFRRANPEWWAAFVKKRAENRAIAYREGLVDGTRHKRVGIKSFLGKHHTEEIRRKIGEANSKIQKGKGNSQYGTFWITDGIQNKKTKNSDMPEGWRKGRVL